MVRKHVDPVAPAADAPTSTLLAYTLQGAADLISIGTDRAISAHLIRHWCEQDRIPKADKTLLDGAVTA
jgi:hypothetical protein